MNKKEIIKRCRALRRNQTHAERILWEQIRNRKINGLKFLRQYPIFHSPLLGRNLFFIADFYCAEKNLVIELDGKIHENQKGYDENRDLILREKGLIVMRFRSEQVNDVIEYIRSLDSPPFSRLIGGIHPPLYA